MVSVKRKGSEYFHSIYFIHFNFRCFSNFPNGLTHFFQECMPEGYTQERVTRFQDDGTLKTYHEIHFQKGVVMNKITLQGEGFKADSPVLTSGVKCFLPSAERTFPYEEGIKSLVHHVSKMNPCSKLHHLTLY